MTPPRWHDTCVLAFTPLHLSPVADGGVVQLPQLQGVLHDQQAMFQVVFNNLKSGNERPFEALPSGITPKPRGGLVILYRWVTRRVVDVAAAAGVCRVSVVW